MMCGSEHLNKLNSKFGSNWVIFVPPHFCVTESGYFVGVICTSAMAFDLLRVNL